MATTTITLRGKEYDVIYEWEYDPNCNINGPTEWYFNKLSAKEVNDLNITNVENDEIMRQLPEPEPYYEDD